MNTAYNEWLPLQVRCEVQRAAAAHSGRGRVLLQAAARLQVGTGQHLSPPPPLPRPSSHHTALAINPILQQLVSYL